MERIVLILVTGGCGFIGSNFILDWLSSSDEPVVNLDKLTYAGNRDNLKSVEKDPRYSFVQGDICDGSLVGRLLSHGGIRAVIHFAAESHVDRSIRGPEDFVSTNVVGTFRVLEAVRSHWGGLSSGKRESFRFVHISTDEVYGSLGSNDAPFSETTRYQPNSPYSASKAASDHLVRSYHHTYGLPVLTTNCSNNYGPFQFPEKLIPLCIDRALEGKELPVYGDGNQVRDWLYVGDHCSAIHRVLNVGRPGEVYNVGGSSERANIDVVKQICSILDVESPREDGRSYSDQISFVKDRPGHDRRYAIDHSKISSELDWRPSESFETGLLKTVRWYLANRWWSDSLRDRKSASF